MRDRHRKTPKSGQDAGRKGPNSEAWDISWILGRPREDTPEGVWPARANRSSRAAGCFTCGISVHRYSSLLREMIACRAKLGVRNLFV